jgi:hypothetical protein
MVSRSTATTEPPSSHTSNSLECALAFLSTWFGNPKAARALVIDPDDPLSQLRGERNGRNRAEAWVGGTFEYLGPDWMAYDVIADRLTAGGHGTAALIVNGWPPHLGTGTHAWNASNYNSQIHWVDAQRAVNDQRPLYADPHGVWALFVHKHWRPSSDHK